MQQQQLAGQTMSAITGHLLSGWFVSKCVHKQQRGNQQKSRSWRFVWRPGLDCSRACSSHFSKLPLSIYISTSPKCHSHRVLYCRVRCAKQGGDARVEKFTLLVPPPRLTMVTTTKTSCMYFKAGVRPLRWRVSVCVLSADPRFFPLGGQENTISNLPLSGSLH